MASNPTTPGLREQRKAETRSRIVEAAAISFSKLGFNGASTRDIAKQAGVGQGLISYHFDSKEALWREAVTYIFESSSMPELPDGFDNFDNFTTAEVKETLMTWVHYYAQYCINTPYLAMMLYQEAGQQGGRLQWMIDEHFAPSMKEIKELYDACMHKGLLREMPFNIFIFSITGLLSTHFTLHEVYQRVTGDDPRIPTVREEIIHHIVNMFLR